MTPKELCAILLPHVPTWDWQEQAACAGVAQPFNPQNLDESYPDETYVDLFYPSRPRPHHAEALAERWCDRCPVMRECLTTAIAQSEEVPGVNYGVWAGTTPLQRQHARMRLSQSGDPRSGSQKCSASAEHGLAEAG